MHFVVDAMNVIGSRPDGWWRDRRGAIEKLVAQLDRWASRSGVEEVTAVLEKPPSPPLEAAVTKIAWAPRPGPDSADAEILSRLDVWLAEGEVTVVTSDRELAAGARSLGAGVQPSSEFRRLLDSL